MDSATLFRILAVCCAIGVYALCARNLFRYSSSSNGDPIMLKAVLLGAGHFAALVIGFVILSDAAGAASAGLYTVIIAVSAFALDPLFTSRWKAQEEMQRKQVEELKAAVASLSNKYAPPPEKSL